MKFLFDLLPLILFFGIFRWGEGHADAAQGIVAKTLSGVMSGTVTAAQAPIILATAVAILASVAQIGYLLARSKKIDPMLWVSLVVILVFGGMTIYFNSETFIKWKPTVLYWCFALALLGGKFILGKNLLRTLMKGQLDLPERIWWHLCYAWIAFFALMGIVNLYVAFAGGFTTKTWVNFKVFGGLGLTFAFVLAQGMYLSKYMKTEA